MWILVQPLHVRVRRRAVEIEVVFLDILPWLLSLLVSPNSRSLRIGLPVPEGQRKTKPLLIVGDAGQTVFAPAIGAERAWS